MAKIILVDDDHDILELCSTLLIHRGHEVRRAEHPLSALQLLRQFSADLVIADGELATYSGLDLIRVIRHDTELCQIPILVLSDADGSQSDARLLEAGAQTILPKPFVPQILLDRAEQLLASNRNRRLGRKGAA